MLTLGKTQVNVPRWWIILMRFDVRMLQLLNICFIQPLAVIIKKNYPCSIDPLAVGVTNLGFSQHHHVNFLVNFFNIRQLSVLTPTLT